MEEAVVLLGFMIRRKLSIVLGHQHLMALICLQFLFWVVERQQRAFSIFLEAVAAIVLIGAYRGMTQDLLRLKLIVVTYDCLL